MNDKTNEIDFIDLDELISYCEHAYHTVNILKEWFLTKSSKVLSWPGNSP